MSAIRSTPNQALPGKKSDAAVPRAVFRARIPPILGWLGIAVTGIALGLFVVLLFPSLPTEWALLILLAIAFCFALVIVGNVRKVLLSLILLDIPFQLDYYIGYQREAARFGAIVGLGISVTTICLLVLYFMWISERLVKGGPALGTLFRDSLPPLLYLVCVGISFLVARDVSYSLYEFFMLAQIFLLYIYVLGTVRDRNDVLFIMALLLIGLVLESLVMIFLQITGTPFRVAGISGVIQPDNNIPVLASRVGGTLGSPNTAASYLSLLLAPALSMLIARVAREYKWLAMIAFGLGTVGLIFSFSRGGWTAFALSTAALFLLVWLNRRLSPKLPLVLIILLTVIFLMFTEEISGRFAGDDLGSAQSRIPQYELAFRIIMDHPLFGVGANNYGLTISEYTTPSSSKDLFVWAVHNKYLLVWAETGIFSLLAFLAFLIGAIRRGLSVWRMNDPILSPLALGFSVALAGQMIHMSVDVFHSRPQVQLLWLAIALVLSMRNIVRESPA